MTTNRRFNSLLLSELQVISNKIDEIEFKLRSTDTPLEDHDFYNFMIEVHMANLSAIQKKLRSRDSELNKKLIFISGSKSRNS